MGQKEDIFAKRLREALQIRKMSQAELSRRTGIPPGDISHYLHAHYEAKQNRVIDFANALDVSEAWLLGLDVPMERTKPQLDFSVFGPQQFEIDVAPILTIILKRRGLPDVEAKRRAESLARIGALTPEGMDLIDAALNLAEKK